MQHFRLVLLLVAVSIYIKLLCFRNLVQIIIMRRTTHTYRHILYSQPFRSVPLILPRIQRLRCLPSLRFPSHPTNPSKDVPEYEEPHPTAHLPFDQLLRKKSTSCPLSFSLSLKNTHHALSLSLRCIIEARPSRCKYRPGHYRRAFPIFAAVLRAPPSPQIEHRHGHPPPQ